MRRIHSQVVLVGFCCSGKSTAGIELANRLDVQFLDIDAVIENKVGESCRHFIEVHGVASFRRQELEVIRDLPYEPMVLATGSGTLTTLETLLHLQRRGTLVWLDVPFDALLVRMDELSRTSIEPHWPHVGLGQIPPLGRLRKSWRRRSRLYMLSDLRVIGDCQTSSVVDVVASALGGVGGGSKWKRFSGPSPSQ